MDTYHFSCSNDSMILYDEDGIGIGIGILVRWRRCSFVWVYSGGKGSERGEERKEGISMDGKIRFE